MYAQLGQYIAIKPVIADLTDIAKVTRVLREEAPDMLVNCASLQSWRVITELPKPAFEQLDQAQFGPWLPMHLTLMHGLMQAVKASGIAAITVNAAFPDAVNPILSRVGLAPDIGVGNVANLIPAVRCAIARLLECAPVDVQVRLYAQHFSTTSRVAGCPASQLPLFYEVKDRPVLPRLPAEAIFSTVRSEFRRLGGIDGQFLTACSAVTVIEGLFSPAGAGPCAGALGFRAGIRYRCARGGSTCSFPPLPAGRSGAYQQYLPEPGWHRRNPLRWIGHVQPAMHGRHAGDAGVFKKTMAIEQSAEFAHELASKYRSFKHSAW
jgi:hypothetical protein